MSRANGRHTKVSAILADNEITSASTPAAERVSGASLVGLWLLIPFALGAVSYALLGIASMLAAPAEVAAEPAVIAWQWWLGVTLALQVVYWVLIAPKRLAGLWAMIPVISLIPTFFIARDALLERSTPSSTTLPSGGEDSQGKAIWLEPES